MLSNLDIAVRKKTTFFLEHMLNKVEKGHQKMTHMCQLQTLTTALKGTMIEYDKRMRFNLRR